MSPCYKINWHIFLNKASQINWQQTDTYTPWFIQYFRKIPSNSRGKSRQMSNHQLANFFTGTTVLYIHLIRVVEIADTAVNSNLYCCTSKCKLVILNSTAACDSITSKMCILFKRLYKCRQNEIIDNNILQKYRHTN